MASNDKFDEDYTLDDSPYKNKEDLLKRLQVARQNLEAGNLEKEDLLSLVQLGVSPESMQNFFGDSKYYQRQSESAGGSTEPKIDNSLNDYGVIGVEVNGKKSYVDRAGNEVKSITTPLSFKNKDTFNKSYSFFSNGDVYSIEDYETWPDEVKQGFKMKNKLGTNILNDPQYKEITSQGYKSLSDISSYFPNSGLKLYQAYGDNPTNRGYFISKGNQVSKVNLNYNNIADQWYLTDKDNKLINQSLGQASDGSEGAVDAINLEDLKNPENVSNIYKRIGDKLFWTNPEHLTDSQPYRIFTNRLIKEFKENKLSPDVSKFIKYNPTTREYQIDSQLAGMNLYVRDLGDRLEIKRNKSYETPRGIPVTNNNAYDMKGGYKSFKGIPATNYNAYGLMHKKGGILKAYNGTVIDLNDSSKKSAFNLSDIINSPSILSGARFAVNQVGNNKIANLAKKNVKALTIDPFQATEPTISGNNLLNQVYKTQGANLLYKANKPFTNSASLYQSTGLDAQMQANNLNMQGELANQEAFKASKNALYETTNANAQRRQEAAMQNRSRALTAEMAKGNIDIQKVQSDKANLDTFLSEAEYNWKKKLNTLRSLGSQSLDNKYAKLYETKEEEMSALYEGEKNKWLATNKGGDFDSSDVGKKFKSSIKADMSNWTIDQQNNLLKERAKLYRINLPSNYLYNKSWQNKFKEGGKLTAKERIEIEKAKGKDRMEIQNAKSMSKYREKDIESKEKILSEMSSLTRELILNAIK